MIHGTMQFANQVEPGLIFRRYELPNGLMLETYEVPATVVRALGMGRIHDALDIWMRGQARREKTSKLVVAITNRLNEGVKPLAIAHELGCSDTYVRMVRAQLESGHGAEPRDQNPEQRAAGRRGSPGRAVDAAAKRSLPGL
jgi:hypothetical protein